MPPGKSEFRLDTVHDLLRTLHVVADNKLTIGETGALVHTSAEHVVLAKPVRRIRVMCHSGTLNPMWFDWGENDGTGTVGRRISVSPFAPLDIILEHPETSFWFRRGTSGGDMVGVIIGTQ